MAGHTMKSSGGEYCEGFRANREVIQWLLPRTSNVCALFLMLQISSIIWDKSGSSDIQGSWELASHLLQGGDENGCKGSTSLS